ncbi:lysine-rich arabinogalactan protein 19-like [Iris pallida]|uniref:Lysine-rich arabinogalactan protein 19-like n=1 Tax=Iris pallida TaxID=29817 RepID=A0AAX6GX08_IRIPA|nr:lysine-rich arabinogalactan protein 19-like [Iris pallida]
MLTSHGEVVCRAALDVWIWRRVRPAAAACSGFVQACTAAARGKLPGEEDPSACAGYGWADGRVWHPWQETEAKVRHWNGTGREGFHRRPSARWLMERWICVRVA